jgi:ribosomal protein S18 acetylase RimI-like enzyme
VELQEHHAALQPHNPRYHVEPNRWLDIARAALDHPDDEVLIAEDERIVIGFATLRYEEKPWGLACQVETLIVSRRLRGHGVGSALLRAGEEAAARRGARGMRVEVLEQNADGRKFYEKRGYGTLALRYGKPIEGAGPPLPPL